MRTYEKLFQSTLCMMISIMCIFFVYPVSAGIWSSSESFNEIQGNYQAEFIRDMDKFTQIRFVGDLDAFDAEGNARISPRAAITQEFYERHKDDYDMLFVISDFNYVLADDVAAFNLGIKNDIQGIRKPIFDNTKKFGSEGRLSSYIDLHSINDWDLDPSSKNYQSLLNTAMHEVMHQWVVGVRASFAGELKNTALIGQKGSHWSALLDTNASLMYGHRWAESEDEKFTATERWQRFSALDLYLAGLYSKEEVPPFRLILSDEISSEVVDYQGKSVAGNSVLLTIEDVIAAEGERTPSFQNSKKNFTAGLVYLTSNTARPSDAVRYQLNQLAKHISTQFSLQTGGRATLNIVTRPKGIRESLSESDTGYLESIDIKTAQNWLRSKQNVNGLWSNNKATQLRDSYTANTILSFLDDEYDNKNYSSGLASETNFKKNNEDLSVLSQKNSNALQQLIAGRNTDAGWGLYKKDETTLFDTVGVLSFSAELIKKENAELILSSQNSDGGWPISKNGVSNLLFTARIAVLLRKLSRNDANITAIDAAIAAAVAYIQAQVLGEIDNLTIAELSHVLMLSGSMQEVIRTKLLNRISSLQLTNGSWNDQVYDTAIAVDAISTLNSVNLTLLEGQVDNKQVVAGEPIVIKTSIRNTGEVLIENIMVRAYLNHVNSDIIVGEYTLESLGVNQQQLLTFKVPTSELEGSQRIIVEIDPNQQLVERTRTDNLIFSDVVISPLKQSIDVAVFSSEVHATPDVLNEFVENVVLTARVRNLSSIDAKNVAVSVYSNLSPSPLNSQAISITKSDVKNVTFPFNLNTKNVHTLYVKADSVEDSDRSNDIASIHLKTHSSVDLETHSVNVDQNQALIVGNPVPVNITVSNSGNNNASRVILTADIDQGKEITSIQRVVNLAAGAIEQINISYISKESGTHNITATLDKANLIAESNELNNASTIHVPVFAADGINWKLRPGQINAEGDLTEGTSAKIRVPIINNGNQEAPATLLSIYVGNPKTGGQLVGQANIPKLLSEQQYEAEVISDPLGMTGEHLVFAVIDDGNQTDEVDETDNTAFSSFFITSLADLSISDALTTLSPALASAGEDVLLTTDIINTGGQPATAFSVEVLLNNESIHTELIDGIDSYSTRTFKFIIDGGLLTSTGQYSVQIDADSKNEVSESNEANNNAETSLLVGSGQLSLSELYISPNGDGIQDSLDIAAQLNEGFNLKIMGSFNEELASYDHLTVMPVNWKGRNAQGHLVSDGKYRVQILDQHNNVVIEQALIVDNNATSPLDYKAKDYAVKVRFRELFGSIGSLHSYADETRFLFQKHSDKGYFGKGVDKIRPGLYTSDFLGRDLTLIAARDNIELSSGPGRITGTRTVSFARNIGAPDKLYIVDLENHTYIDTGLVDANYSGVVTNLGVVKYSQFFFHENAIYLAGLHEEQLKLLRMDPATYLFEEITAQSECNIEFSDDAQRSQLEKFPEDHIYLFRNCMVDYKKQKIFKFDGTLRDYHQETVAYISESEELIVEDINYNEIYRFNVNEYYKTRGNNNGIAAYRVVLDIDRSRLMFYTRGDLQYKNGVEVSLAEQSLVTEGFDSIEGMGYRLEIDISKDDVTLRNFNLPMVKDYRGGFNNDADGSMEWEVATNSYDESIGLHNKHLQDGVPVTFNGFSAGRYLSSGEFYDKSYYLKDVIPNPRSTNILDTHMARFIPTFSYETDRELLQTDYFVRNNLHQNNPYYTRPQQVENYGGYHIVKTPDMTSYFLMSVSESTIGFRVLATDQNFESYTLEYRLTGESWVPMISESRPRYDETVFDWVPPAEGSYDIRIETRDKAGNVREYSQSLVWTEGAFISGVNVDNLAFSPNNDGVKDRVNVTLRVLRPTNVRYRVESNEGIIVREETIGYDQNGPQRWEWDGRDLNGDIVPDGFYNIYINDARYIILLDTIYPEFNVEFNASDRVPAPLEFYEIDNQQISFSVVEISQSSEKDKLTCHETYGEGYKLCSVEEDGYIKYPMISNVPKEILLSLEDTAGNKTVFNNFHKQLVPEIRIERFVQAVPSYFQKDLHLYGLPIPLNYSERYGVEGGDDYKMPGLLLVEDDYDGEIQLNYFGRDTNTIKLGQAYVVKNDDGASRVEYDFSDVFLQGEEFRGALKIQVSDLLEQASKFKFVADKEPFIFFYTEQNSEIIKSSLIGYTRPSGLDFQLKYLGGTMMSYRIASDFEEFDNKVYLQAKRVSEDDPFYTQQLIFSSDSNDRIEFSRELELSAALSPCTNYRAEIRYFRYGQWQTFFQSFTTGCLNVTFTHKLLDVSELMCGTDAPIKIGYEYYNYKNKAGIFVTTTAENVVNTAFFLGKENSQVSAGKKYIYSGRASPIGLFGRKKFVGEFYIDKSNVDMDQVYKVYAELTLKNGDVRTYQLQDIAFDNQLPVIEISAPTSGDKICAQQYSYKNEDDEVREIYWTPIKGSVLDHGALNVGKYNPHSLSILEVQTDYYSGFCNQDKDPSTIPPELTCSTETINTESGGRHISYTLGDLNKIQVINGRSIFSYFSADTSGNTACGTLEVMIDAEMEVHDFKVDTVQMHSNNTYGVSPNNDERHETLKFRYRLEEAAEIAVYIDGSEVYSSNEDSGPVVTELDRELRAFSDGLYPVRVVFTDECGFEAEQQFSLVIDRKPPKAIIHYPVDGDELFAVTGVNITAQDDYIGSYSLGIAEHNSEVYRSLKAQKLNDNIIAGTPYYLNVTDLSGVYRLKLMVEDKVGNRSEIIEPITIGQVGELISDYSLEHDFVSPNSDDIQDTLKGELTLMQDAEVGLYMGDRLVSHLGLLKAGVNAWTLPEDSLSSLADGQYELTLLAAVIKGDKHREEIGRLKFFVDNTQPVLVLTDVQGAEGIVHALVTENHTQNIRYRVVNKGGEDVLTGVLPEFTSPDTQVWVNLPAAKLPEGQYVLNYTIDDQAGNTLNFAHEFIFDITKPNFELDKPFSDAPVFNPQEISLALALDYQEENLRFIDVEFNNSAVSRYDKFENGEYFSANINWQGIEDGHYSGIVELIDVNGNSAEQPLIFTIDRQLPKIVFNERKYVKPDQKMTTQVIDETSLSGKLLVNGQTEKLFSAINEQLDWLWPSYLSDGEYTVALSATDEANNRSQKNTVYYQDSERPEAPAAINVQKTDDGADVSWTSSTSVDVVEYQVFRNKEEITKTPESLYVDNSVSSGTHEYYVIAVDRAGNYSEASPIGRLDTQAPQIRILSPQEGSTLRGRINIRGDVDADDLKEYTVLLEHKGIEQQLSRSTSSGRDLLLGYWDSTEENGSVKVTLRAEDLSGNINEISKTYFIDNEPLQAPSGFTAELINGNVEMTWNKIQSNSPVAYQIWRSTRALSANNLMEPTYTDQQPADGIYQYSVVALDQAGNLSQPSESVTLTIDNRAPHINVVSPLDGDSFENSLPISIISADQDIQLLKAELLDTEGLVVFTTAFTQKPYSEFFDTSGLAYTQYRLRITATDVHNNTTTLSMGLEKKDSTAPSAPTLVNIQGKDESLIVRWQASESSDVDHYEILLTQGSVQYTRSVSVLTAEFTGVAEGIYTASVRAVDKAGNNSLAADSSEFTVVKPDIDYPYSPTGETLVDVTIAVPYQGLLAFDKLESTLFSESIQSDEDNPVVVPLELSVGEHIYDVSGEPAAGGNLFPSQFRMQVAEKPATPAAPDIESVDLQSHVKFSLSDSLPEGEFWFPRIGGDLLLNLESVAGSSVVSWDIKNGTKPAFSDWEDEKGDFGWFSGVFYQIPTAASDTEVVKVKAWNGVNWMLIPFENKLVQQVATVALFQHPVYASKLRLYLRSGEERLVAGWNPISMVLYEEADIVTAPFNGLLNTSSFGVSATRISTERVIGEESSITKVDTEYLDPTGQLPEIVLTASIEEGAPVLEFTTTPNSYSGFFVLVNDGEQILQVGADGSGDYRQVIQGATAGTHTYKVVGLTADDTFRQSNFVSITLTISEPQIIEGLEGNYNAASGAIDLQWQTSVGAMEYKIYRKHLLETQFTQQAVIEQNHWSDENVSLGTRYRYYIVATGQKNQVSLPSEIVVVDTEKAQLARPTILNPLDGLLTDRSSSRLLVDTFPGLNARIYNNDDSVHDYQASSEFIRGQLQLSNVNVVDLGNSSRLITESGRYWIDPLTRGLIEPLDSRIAQKVRHLAGKKTYMLNESTLTYITEQGEQKSWDGVKEFAVSSNGEVLIYRTADGFQAEDREKLIPINVSGIASLLNITTADISPAATVFSVLSDAGVSLYQRLASGYVPTEKLLPKEAVLIQEWLSEDRLLIETTETIRLYNSALEAIAIIPKQTNDAQYYYVGFYAEKLVLGSTSKLTDEQKIHVHSIQSGKRMYQWDSIVYPANVQMTAFGQLCGGEKASSTDRFCYFLPGVDQVDVDLPSISNRFRASIISFNATTPERGNVVQINRRITNASNISVKAESITRSPDEISTLRISMNHIYGNEVVVSAVNANILTPAGDTIYASYEGADIELSSSNNNREILLPWTAPIAGEYSINVDVTASDDDDSDNGVVFSTRSVVAGIPSLELLFDRSTLSFRAKLDSGSWKGEGVLELAWKNGVLSDEVVLSRGGIESLTTKTFTHAISELPWLESGFDAALVLKDEQGDVIQEAALSVVGKQPIFEQSIVSLTEREISVRGDEPIRLAYRIVADTSLWFSGNVRLTVTDTSGETIELGVYSHRYVFDGDVISNIAILPSGKVSPGNYRLTAELIPQNGTVISSDSTTMFVQHPPVEYQGGLILSSNTIGMNDPFTASVNVSSSISDTPQLINIYLQVGEEDILVSNMSSADLPFNQDVVLSGQTRTRGDFELSLVVQEVASGIRKGLTSSNYSVVDVVPPKVTMVSPQHNQFISNATLVEVNAEDTHSGIEAVIAITDKQLEIPMTLNDRGFFVTTLSSLTEGAHTLRVKALDVAGNSTLTDAITLYVDNQSPQLTFTGAANDQFYNKSITLLAAATDTNLSTVGISINGIDQNGLSVTLSEDGSYDAQAVAIDKAGNQAAKNLRFVVDQTSPEILVEGVADGAVYTESVDYSVSVNDEYPADVAITDGTNAIPAQGTIEADGSHRIVVVAHDQAGNLNESEVIFLIDTEAPDVPTINLSDGQQLEDSDVILNGLTEADSRVLLEVNGIEYVASVTGTSYSQAVLLNEGVNTIRRYARDSAGNQSDTETINVSVITTPEINLVSESAAVNKLLVWAPWYSALHDEETDVLRSQLDQMKIEYQIKTHEAEFRSALRSQKFNSVLMLHSSHVLGIPSGFSFSLSAELRGMVANGLGLITVADSISLFDVWNDVYGLVKSKSDVNGETVHISDGELGQYDLDISGRASRLYVNEEAYSVGRLNVACRTIFGCRSILRGEYPGLVYHPFGAGRVVTLPFDIMTAVPSADAMRLLKSVIRKVAPLNSVKHYADSALRIRALSSGDEDGISLKVEYDETAMHVYRDDIGKQVLSGDTISQVDIVLNIILLKEGKHSINVAAFYKDQEITVEQISIPYSSTTLVNDWDALESYVNGISVPWYRYIKYLIVKDLIEDAREIELNSDQQITHARVKLLMAMIKIKELVSDSEKASSLAGKILLRMQFLESKQ